MKKLDQLIQEKAQRQRTVTVRNSPEHNNRSKSRTDSKSSHGPQNTVKLLEQHVSWLEAAKKEAQARAEYTSNEKTTRERVESQRRKMPHYAQPTQTMKIREELNHQLPSADTSFHSKVGQDDRLNKTMLSLKNDTSFLNETLNSIKSTNTRMVVKPSHVRAKSTVKTPPSSNYTSITTKDPRVPSSSPRPSSKPKNIPTSIQTALPVKLPQTQSKVYPASSSNRNPTPPRSKQPTTPTVQRVSTGSNQIRGRSTSKPTTSKNTDVRDVRQAADHNASKTPQIKAPGKHNTGRLNIPLVQKLMPIGKNRAAATSKGAVAGEKSSSIQSPTQTGETTDKSQLLQRTGSPGMDDMPNKLMQQVSTNAPLVSHRDSLDHSGFVHLETLSQNGMFSGKGENSDRSDDLDEQVDEVNYLDHVAASKNKSYRYADWDLVQSAKQSKKNSAVQSTRNSWDKKSKLPEEVKVQIDHLFKKDSGAVVTLK
jgi:hypothetical protein